MFHLRVASCFRTVNCHWNTSHPHPSYPPPFPPRTGPVGAYSPCLFCPDQGCEPALLFKGVSCGCSLEYHSISRAPIKRLQTEPSLFQTHASYFQKTSNCKAITGVLFIPFANKQEQSRYTDIFFYNFHFILKIRPPLSEHFPPSPHRHGLRPPPTDLYPPSPRVAILQVCFSGRRWFYF